jgi:hypothetical protein
MAKESLRPGMASQGIQGAYGLFGGSSTAERTITLVPPAADVLVPIGIASGSRAAQHDRFHAPFLAAVSVLGLDISHSAPTMLWFVPGSNRR